MIIWGVLGAIGALFVVLAGVFLIQRKMERYIDAKQCEIEERLHVALRSWVEPQADGKMSRFAEILDSMGAVVGTAAARSIMQSLQQGEARAGEVAAGVTRGIQTQQNPLLTLLSGGKRGKGAAITQLAEILGPMLAGKSGTNHEASGKQSPFSL